MSENETITVELEDGRMFEVEATAGTDLGRQARHLLDAEAVTEKREGGSFTIHPRRVVKAVHVGEVPKKSSPSAAKPWPTRPSNR